MVCGYFLFLSCLYLLFEPDIDTTITNKNTNILCFHKQRPDQFASQLSDLHFLLSYRTYKFLLYVLLLP